ncbi:chromate transporter, partial [Erythrobacter donghaensis]|uniref:chromate transporter n=1 Tax=Erythrobacter donghaensis TaxID=267135 RepID=UPI000AED1E3A
GGLAAGLLFVIPGAAIILALSVLYALAANLGWVAALFTGVKAAVLAIVMQALLRIAGLFLLALPFPLIVLGAGA